MLNIVRTMSSLRFSELMDVYLEGNLENGNDCYPSLPPEERLRRAEEDFYHYLNSVFFCQSDSYYAIWEVDGCYKAALRLEPYSDGLLLCSLETAPKERRRGYGTQLIRAVQKHLMELGRGKLYSHVSKRNAASLSVHKKCDFKILKDHAVYSDGSVMNNSFTLVYVYEKSEI